MAALLLPQTTTHMVAPLPNILFLQIIAHILISTVDMDNLQLFVQRVAA